MVDGGAEDRADGRTARRDRNREAVLDAVLELFREDAVYPGPAEVATRSGVSLRSVYRYFEDMETLVRAAMTRHLDRLQPLFVIENPGAGPLVDRVDQLVDQRLRLYDAVAPMMRAAVLRVRSNDLIRERLEENRRGLRHQIAEVFAPELGELTAGVSREVVAALDVLLEFESMEHLRRERSMAEPAARQVLVRAVKSMLRFGR